jgi:predicted NBD/HSP70 family sugar kinase
MERIYGRPLEVRRCEAAELPPARETALPLGGHTEGCRIGFDAGGSDRKVAAVQDGRVVYAAETVWHPKEAADPRYHYEGVVAALREAAARLPRVDAIGISSAGVIVAGEPRVSSLFLSVDGARQRETRSLYLRAARAIGDVPLAVANDGDVAALAGAMALGRGDVLGLAMGTSQAAGYVDGHFGLSGRLHELAFVPVDLSEAAPTDPWSGDRGVGAQYFSQEGVIRLARAAGLPLTDGKPPAEQLMEVQILAAEGHTGAERVFRSLGVYLAHALPLYDRLCPMGHVLLLGRVCSGTGGAWLLESCRAALERDHPALGARLRLHLPEEHQRRVGQAVAAASLPATK